jgi:hypothetical protein
MHQAVQDRVIIFLLTGFIACGCRSGVGRRATGPGPALPCKGEAGMVSEGEALAIAERALSQRHVGSLGSYAAEYDISTVDLGKRWKFRFVGKVRRPGNDHEVFVDKSTSEAEVILGE